ncbi:hypothetical protein XELAEV_18042019mg [Xenopus laevis]|uniref:Uncharacterized protein n=1 Tax=Xenopus laevis TaxID=8355 RepID=A0A974C335_XENLA|nr:hypothetical protein XELAEV_18042019mg [Xenopus laevis]
MKIFIVILFKSRQVCKVRGTLNKFYQSASLIYLHSTLMDPGILWLGNFRKSWEHQLHRGIKALQNPWRQSLSRQ